MSHATISVNDGTTHQLLRLTSAADVDQLLERISGSQDQTPLMAVATIDSDPFGPLLEFGVRGAVGFVYHTGDQAQAISCGLSSSEAFVHYRFHDLVRPVPASAEIPLAEVGAAIKLFASAEGRRPDNVRWTEADRLACGPAVGESAHS